MMRRSSDIKDAIEKIKKLRALQQKAADKFDRITIKSAAKPTVKKKVQPALKRKPAAKKKTKPVVKKTFVTKKLICKKAKTAPASKLKKSGKKLPEETRVVGAKPRSFRFR